MQNLTVMSAAEETDRSKEPLTWDADREKAVSGVKPSAKYGPVSESLRHTIPEPKTCAMFCRGKKCKYCNPWGDEAQVAVKGLYSAWVTENILATARPTTPVIEKYNIIEQFERFGITSIINLQQPGEHASCGPGLEPEGFSYVPQTFMDNNIFFYNFGWQDYGVGSLTNILDMIKVMQFALSEGKVAVHCHAGLGRTGVLIACYLVFANRIDPGDAIHYVREKRPSAIQTTSQIQCIMEFGRYIKPLRIVYSNVSDDTYSFTLAQYLIRQKHMMHGWEARELRHIPKVVASGCQRLLELAGRGELVDAQKDSIISLKRTCPSAFHNVGRPAEDPGPPHKIMSSTSMEGTGITPLRNKSVSLESFTASGLRLKASNSSHCLSPKSSSSSCDVTDPEELRQLRMRREASDLDLAGTVSSHYVFSSETSTGTAEAVAAAMARSDYSQEEMEKTRRHKCNLNDENGAWRALHVEESAAILSALMWDWLDALKEPVLQTQDLPHVLEYVREPLEGLALLDKGSRHTVLFIFNTISRLEPLPEQTKVALIQRALCVLTHQNIALEVTDDNLVRRTANDNGFMRHNVAYRLMAFFVHLLDELNRKHARTAPGTQTTDAQLEKDAASSLKAPTRPARAASRSPRGPRRGVISEETD